MQVEQIACVELLIDIFDIYFTNNCKCKINIITLRFLGYIQKQNII